jgi:hypothetical protein
MGGGAGEGSMMRRLGLLLAILVLAPGCRVLAGAAVIIGEAALEAALHTDDDDDRDREAPRRKERGEPRRAPAASRDPCR